jgi:hypothetical protein
MKIFLYSSDNDLLVGPGVCTIRYYAIISSTYYLKLYNLNGIFFIHLLFERRMLPGWLENWGT